MIKSEFSVVLHHKFVVLPEGYTGIDKFILECSGFKLRLHNIQWAVWETYVNVQKPMGSKTFKGLSA